MNNLIGITERGDPVFDFNWLPWVQEGNPAILITKNPAKLYEVLTRIKNSKNFNVIVHCTITGYGESVIEPNVPLFMKSINGYHDLYKYFGKDRVVLRVDPIIPTEKGIDLAKQVIEHASKIPTTQLYDGKVNYSSKVIKQRIRISFIDNYDHVKERFRMLEIPELPWDFHAPLDLRLKVWEELGKPEVCGEPGITCTGCVSETDCKIFGVEPIDISKGQRKHCACLMNKKELLTVRGRCAHNCAYCYYGKNN